MIGGLKLVGLTGGIGSGKSTVGKMIEALGVPLIDADQLARDVVSPGKPAHADIAAVWPDVLRADGTIDRKKLGQIVFSDVDARRRLEAITHPRIQTELLKQARHLESIGHRLAFYEASLLVETGRYRDFDALVVVIADEDQQLARTAARDGSTIEAARARLKAQLPLADKRTVATHVIDNAGDLANTEQQVKALVATLRQS